MTVPIQIPWDMHLGRIAVWSDCLAAGVRRAVLLPRLETIFSPTSEDPGRERSYDELDWRLVSPTEADWERYREITEKQAARHDLHVRLQRVESLARWAGGAHVTVPQYHIWMYRDDVVGNAIETLYDELDALKRRDLWRWLLAWTAPANTFEPYDPR